jgi:hypothetical protein
MPTISKVTSVKATGKSFDTPNGTLYPYQITISDGTIGEANSKTPQPIYQVGDTVGYEVTKVISGVKKLKIMNSEQALRGTHQTKAAPDAPYPVTHTQVTNAKFNSDGMERGMCLKLANDILICNANVNKVAIDLMTYNEELYDAAEKALAASNKLKAV